MPLIHPYSRHSTSRPKLIPGIGLILAGLAIVLVGCGGNVAEDDNRQFANERSTEAPQEPTEGPVVPDGVVPTEMIPTALSPDAAEQMLDVSSAPDGVMVRLGNEIAIVDPLHPDSNVSVKFTDSWNLLAFAPSPAGGRLVGLLRGPDGQLGVELRNTRGERLANWDLSAWIATDSTPVAVVGDEAGFAISWTGELERVLATISGNTLVSIDLAGDAEEIDLPSGVGNLVEASWSPLGDRIAMLGLGADGAGVVSIVNPNVDGESFRQIIPPPADAANLGSVTRFSWLPDGGSIVYILAQDAGATNPGGNLYRLDVQNRQRQVVATPGRGGPTAQIVDFTVAPDGSAVSYIIASPTDDIWTYHSLWIRSLSSALHLQVDTTVGLDVTGMWWAGPGFVWRTTVDGQPVLYYADQRTDRAEIWTPPVSDEATPMVASPVAIVSSSPIAQSTPASGTPAPADSTPQASPAPGATPVS